MSFVLLVKEFDEEKLNATCEVIDSTDNKFHIGNYIVLNLDVEIRVGKISKNKLVGKEISCDRLFPSGYFGNGIKMYY